jgi:hypothetical protein
VSIGADGDYAFLVYEFTKKGLLNKWLYHYRPPSSSPSAVSVSVATLSWE